jgi:hypothetical protein
MLDEIKKWWNRKWSNWEIEREYYSWVRYNTYIVLKSTSNDGLIRFKELKKK